jgi:hypothetical protein
MSLEEALAANTAAMLKHNDLLTTLISKGQVAKEGKAETAAERKAREKVEADAAAASVAKVEPVADKAPTPTTVLIGPLKEKLTAWLSEFAHEDDATNPDGMHRELKARKVALKATLEKLGTPKLGDITSQVDVERLEKWLDKQVAIGRLALDPAPIVASDIDDL